MSKTAEEIAGEIVVAYLETQSGNNVFCKQSPQVAAVDIAQMYQTIHAKILEIWSQHQTQN
jgi:hypothetical protein